MAAGKADVRRLLPLTTLVTLLLVAASSFPTAESHTFAAKLPSLKLTKEKLTHLHFYWSNVRGGPNGTGLLVAPILNNSTFYGAVVLNDDTLSLGPEVHNSTAVGKARGVYYFPSDTANFVYEMMYTFAFTYGDYNGSSISLLGSVFPTSGTAGDLTVAGGTGVFRFARGYAVVKLFLFDPLRNLVVNELDVYVSHY